MLVVIGIAIGLVIGVGVAFLSLYAFTGSRLAAARRTRQLLVTEARRDAEALKREAQIAAREESVRVRAEIEEEVAARRGETIKIEERILSKEEEIDGKLTEQDVQRFEEHLKLCGPCVEYVEQVRTTSRLAAVARLEIHPDREALLAAFREFRS